VLYQKDVARPFLPASVTKTMTTFVAFELLSQGKIKPDQLITVSNQAYRDWHMTGSRMFLEQAQKVTVDQLLTGIMTVSANDGAVVLGEGVAGSVKGWTDMMNATAHQLGMTDSYFNTPNGYMDKGQTYVSARDLVKLATAMIERHPDLYHRYVGRPGWCSTAWPRTTTIRCWASSPARTASRPALPARRITTTSVRRSVMDDA
jgi:D-alanyl-D-alanine carboxypeptidase (penicillin-binding protein 5/6)